MHLVFLAQQIFPNSIDLFQHYLYNTENVGDVKHWMICVWWFSLNMTQSHSQFDGIQFSFHHQKQSFAKNEKLDLVII